MFAFNTNFKIDEREHNPHSATNLRKKTNKNHVNKALKDGFKIPIELLKGKHP